MDRSLPCAQTLSETLGGSGGHPCFSFLANSSWAKTERFVQTLGISLFLTHPGRKSERQQSDQALGILSSSVTDCVSDVVSLYLSYVGSLDFASQVILRPRLAIAMTGLDLDLYEQCLRVRREFEARYDCNLRSTR
jgi:hypothetical protein